MFTPKKKIGNPADDSPASRIAALKTETKDSAQKIAGSMIGSIEHTRARLCSAVFRAKRAGG